MKKIKRIALVETLTVDNGSNIANPVSVQRYQLGNNIESATLELDENAQIISYEEYYPYGDTSYQAGRSAAEVSQKRYRYTGKEKDEESGLYYMLARYYSGWLGRWTAADPAGLVDGVNLYAYCGNNPLIYVDPTGTIVEGVSEASAKKMQNEIRNSFYEEKERKYDKLRRLFKLNTDSTDSEKKNQMQKIDEEAFNEAIADLSSDDERALAYAYFLVINSDDTHYVDMVERGETLNSKTIEKSSLKEGTTGADVDKAHGGGKNTVDTQQLRTYKHGGFIVSKKIETTSVVVTNSKTKIPDFVSLKSGESLSAPSSAGELLSHELLGHGYSHSLERNKDEQHQDAIQMTNLYLRVKGAKYYRSGAEHDTKVNLGKQKAQEIPRHFRK
jgi:RHS repeat-associated protein